MFYSFMYLHVIRFFIIYCCNVRYNIDDVILLTYLTEGTALLDELKKKAITAGPTTESSQADEKPQVKEGGLMLQVIYIYSYLYNFKLFSIDAFSLHK